MSKFIENAIVETWYRVVLKRGNCSFLDFGVFLHEEEAIQVLQKIKKSDKSNQKKLITNKTENESHGVSVARSIMSALSEVKDEDLVILPINVITNDSLKSEGKGFYNGKVVHLQDLTKTPRMYES